MVTFLTNIEKNKKAKYLKCEDISKGNELISYGFISGVNIEVVAKLKHCVIVAVLDGVYSLNLKLAKKIVVEVK